MKTDNILNMIKVITKDTSFLAILWSVTHNAFNACATVKRKSQIRTTLTSVRPENYL